MIYNTLYKKKHTKLISEIKIKNQIRYYPGPGKKTIEKIVEKSKHFIGQSNADLNMGDRVEDIKHNANTYHIVKNIIQPWTYERIEKDFSSFMSNYIAFFDNNILKKNLNDFNRKFYKSLVNIYNDPKLTIHEKNFYWNQVFAQNWYRLAETTPTPIILQMTNKPYEVKANRYLHENLHIPTDVLDKPMCVHKTIYDCINLLGKEYKKNAEELTLGVICDACSEID